LMLGKVTTTSGLEVFPVGTFAAFHCASM
jgi:hypothetical protein